MWTIFQVKRLTSSTLVDILEQFQIVWRTILASGSGNSPNCGRAGEGVDECDGSASPTLNEFLGLVFGELQRTEDSFAKRKDSRQGPLRK